LLPDLFASMVPRSAAAAVAESQLVERVVSAASAVRSALERGVSRLRTAPQPVLSPLPALVEVASEQSDGSDAETWFRADVRRQLLVAMLRNLRTLTWERVDVWFPEGMRFSLAHEDIVVRRARNRMVCSFGCLFLGLCF
jgi:hypothetical protein